jgi:hypothetical protein
MDIYLNEIRKDAISKFDSSFSYQSVVDAIVLTVEAATLGRKEGLLALEDRFNDYVADTNLEKFMSKAMILVVDATDPFLVSEILTGRYWANNYTGNDALACYCLIRGILLVQQGENPYSIERILLSVFPMDIVDEVEKEIDIKRNEIRKQTEAQILQWYEEWEGIDQKVIDFKPKIENFEALIQKYDDKDIQRILREVDNADLELALIVVSKECRNKFLNNMSTRLRAMILEDMQNIIRYYTLYIRPMERVIDKITAIISKLAEYGDIQRLI